MEKYVRTQTRPEPPRVVSAAQVSETDDLQDTSAAAAYQHRIASGKSLPPPPWQGGLGHQRPLAPAAPSAERMRHAAPQPTPEPPAPVQRRAHVLQAWGLPDWVTEGAAAVGNAVGRGVRAVGRGASQVAEGVSGGVRRAADAVGSGVRRVSRAVRRGVRRVVDGVSEGAAQVRDLVVEGAETVRSGVRGAARRTGRSLRRGARQVASGVANLAGRIRSGALSLLQQGRDLVQRGARRLQRAGQSVREGVRQAGEQVAEFGRRALQLARQIGQRTQAAVSRFVERLRRSATQMFDHVFSLATLSDAFRTLVFGGASLLDRVFGPEGTAVQTTDIPDAHAFDEFVARELAYVGAGNELGTLTAEQIARLRAEGFEEQIQTVPGLAGFQMTYLIPRPDSGRNPMLAIRGSESNADFFQDWGSDFDQEQVGERQYNANREQIAELIEYLCLNSPSGQIDLTGHSLGGGLAQNILSHHTAQVARLTTFAAPGQSQATMDRYQQNLAALREQGLSGPEVAHHVEDQGLIYLVGDGHLPGTTYRHDVGHIDLITAHTTNLVDGLEGHRVTRYDEFPAPVQSRIAEMARRGAGHIVVPVFNELERLRRLRRVHYERNQFNQAPETEPVDDPNWRRLPDSQSVYHQHGEAGRTHRKYVSTDGGHHEAVYNQDGELVTDPQNLGTYNFVGPDDAMGHFKADVLPYWVWGNSPEDETPLLNRIFGPRLWERAQQAGEGLIDSLRDQLHRLIH